MKSNSIKINGEIISYGRFFEMVHDKRFIKQCRACRKYFEVGDEIFVQGSTNRYGGYTKLCLHITCLLNILKLCKVQRAGDLQFRRTIDDAVVQYKTNREVLSGEQPLG